MAKREAIKDLADLQKPIDTGNGDEEPGLNPTLEEVDPSITELEEALKSNDLAGGRCRLSRRGPTDADYSFIGKFKTSDFDIDTIKKVYGGGEYQVKFFRINGEIGGTRTFSIDPRFIGAIEHEHGKGISKSEGTGARDAMTLMKAATEMNRPDPGQGKMMEAMMSAQSESTKMMMMMMMESSKQQAAASAESNKMMMTMMAGVFQAMGGRPSGGGLEMKDLPALLTLMKGGGDKSAAPSLNELMDAVIKMRSLSDHGGSESDEPKTFVDKMLALAPHVANTVSALRGQSAPAAPVASLPAGAGGALPAAASPSPAAVVPSGNDLESSLALVVSAARRKADVSLYHDMLMDVVTDDQVPMLQEALTHESWFSMLFGKLPDATALQPWLTELRNQVLLTLNQPPADSHVNGSASTAGAENTAGVRSEGDPSGAGQN